MSDTSEPAALLQVLGCSSRSMPIAPPRAAVGLVRVYRGSDTDRRCKQQSLPKHNGPTRQNVVDGALCRSPTKGGQSTASPYDAPQPPRGFLAAPAPAATALSNGTKDVRERLALRSAVAA